MTANKLLLFKDGERKRKNLGMKEVKKKTQKHINF